MKVLKKIYDIIVNIEGWVAQVALGVAILLNAYEILQRNLWGNSFIWVQEISVLLMLWFAMLGLPKVVHCNEDINLDLFVNKLPPNVRKISDLFVSVVLAVVDLVILVNLWKLYLSQGTNVTIVAKYPLRLRSLALLIGIGTVEIRYLVNVVANVGALFKKGKEGGTME